ncbi:MAG: DHHA1 domain-containing protein, partial [Pararhizobium sp.]
EALTGEGARAYLAAQDERVKTLANVLKVGQGEVIDRVETLVDERRRLERELTEARKKLALSGGSGSSAAGEGVRDVNGVKFLGRVVTGVEPKDLKGLADEGKKSLGSGVVAFVGVAPDGKASVVVAVTGDLNTRISAVDLVRTASSVLGGKGGGGRPDMAQAGGPDGDKAPAAIEAVAAALAA